MSNENDTNQMVLAEGSVSHWGASGKLAISQKVPEALYRLMPQSWRFRREANDAIKDGLIDKLRRSESFDDAELEFLEATCGEEAAKFVRKKRILARGSVLLTESYPALPEHQPPPAHRSSPHGGGTTSSDWVNRFWEDAGLVDDEMLQELYARILAQEGSRAGSVSLRTLGVLRYLDRAMAEGFGKVMQVLVLGIAIPAQSGKGKDALRAAGLDHKTLCALDDCGLVKSSINSQHETTSANQVFTRFLGQKAVVAVSRPEPFSVKLPIHLLTQAGKEFVHVAQCNGDPTVLDALIRWLHSNLDKQARREATFAVAPLPRPDWEGPAQSLTWTEWTPPEPAR